MEVNNNSRYSKEFQFVEFGEDILSHATQGANPELLFEITEKIVQSVQQKASFWGTIVSYFYRLVGRVSDYERLQQKAYKLQMQLDETLGRIDTIENSKALLTSSGLDQLDADLEAAKRLQNKLAKAKDQVGDVVAHLNNEIQAILVQFDDVEEFLNGLERQCASKPATTQQFFENINQAARMAKFLKTIESFALQTSQIYMENIADLSLVKSLFDRYEAMTVKLKGIQNLLVAQWFEEQEQTKNAELFVGVTVQSAATPTRIGGIRNGGNTCYVASAVQTIHAIPSYRKAMDPEQNPLHQRAKESKRNFAKRKLIQQLGHAIIQKIERGQEVSPNEINAFRKACYQDRSNSGKRVVDSLANTADAAETLERIMNVLDYRFGAYQVTERRVPLSVYTISKGSDPKEFTPLEKMRAGKVDERSPTIEVAAYNYLDQEVSMQRLVDETWADEEISKVRVASVDENGLPCVRKYPRMVLRKNASAIEPPEVIRITIKQLEASKATITQADTIFPMGSGKGPRYVLKSVIEHRVNPSHYVAHIRDKDGKYVEANDSWVHAGQKNLPGVAYYYVRADLDE